MKKKFNLIVLLFIALSVKAQDNAGFFLIPSKPQELSPNQSLKISLAYAALPGDDSTIDLSGTSLSDYEIQWTVNGKKIDALSPADGQLNTAHGFNLASVIYTAPNVAPAKNPVAVAVQVKTKDGSTLWLVCNIKILKAQYKITLEAEQTLSEAGLDIKLQGECFTTLKPLDDGTYMLEPVDKTRNMNITIKQNKLANADGAVSQIISPEQYKFPFLFTIANLDKNSKTGKATVYLNTTAPQNGIVKNETTADGKTVTTIVDIDKGSLTTIAPGYTHTYPIAGGGTMYVMDGLTHLNLLTNFDSDIGTTMQNINQNLDDEKEKVAWAKRMQTHKNDPNYYQSAQGKKDMLMMQSFQQQMGGNIRNESSEAANIRQEMTKKMEQDPKYAGSAQFKSDLSKLHLVSSDNSYFQKSPMAEVAPGTARLRITGNFNTKSSEAFSESRENVTGPMHTTLKIKVEKLNK